MTSFRPSQSPWICRLLAALACLTVMACANDFQKPKSQNKNNTEAPLKPQRKILPRSPGIQDPLEVPDHSPRNRNTQPARPTGTGAGLDPADNQAPIKGQLPKQRKALIILSSAKQNALRSLGVSFYELAQILRKFEKQMTFHFASPNGQVPQIAIESLDLNHYRQHQDSGFSYLEKLAELEAETLPSNKETMQGLLGMDKDPEVFRRQFRTEFDQREEDIRAVLRHLGQASISPFDAGTHTELKDFRDYLVQQFQAEKSTEFWSFQRLVDSHREVEDPFKLGDFDFVFIPGGSANAADLANDAYLGEILNILHEEKVMIVTSGQGAVALVSARRRVDTLNRVTPEMAIYPLRRSIVATLSEYEEKLLAAGSGKSLPALGQDAVETTLRMYGFAVLQGGSKKVFKGTRFKAGRAKVEWDEKHGVLSANGPVAIPKLLEKLEEMLESNKKAN